MRNTNTTRTFAAAVLSTAVLLGVTAQPRQEGGFFYVCYTAAPGSIATHTEATPNCTTALKRFGEAAAYHRANASLN